MRNPLSLEETRSNAALTARWLSHYGHEVVSDATPQHRCLNHYPITVVRPFEDAPHFYACVVCGAHHICCSDSRTCERRNGYCTYRALFIVQQAPCHVSDEQARFDLVRQWMLHLERYHFIYNIGDGGAGGPQHQCLDPENRQNIIRPFEAVDYFYGCTVCGRYHICYVDYTSCDTVDISLNPNSDRPICAYSGEAVRNKLNLTMGWADERRCEIDMKLCDFDRFARTDCEPKPVKPSSYSTVYARAEQEHTRTLNAIRAAAPSTALGLPLALSSAAATAPVINEREQRQIDKQNMNKYFRAGGATGHRVKDKKQTNRLDDDSDDDGGNDDEKRVSAVQLLRETDEDIEINALILRAMKNQRKRKRTGSIGIAAATTGGGGDDTGETSEYESLELYSPAPTLRNVISAPLIDDAMQLFLQATSDDETTTTEECDTYDPIRAVRRRAERDDARRMAAEEATATLGTHEDDADAYDADGVYIEAATTLFGDGGNGGDDDDARTGSTNPSLFDTGETATCLKNVHDNTRFWDCYYGFLLDKTVLRPRQHAHQPIVNTTTTTNEQQFAPNACLYSETDTMDVAAAVSQWFIFDSRRLTLTHTREINTEIERIVRLLLAVSVEHRNSPRDDDEATLERLASSLTRHYTPIVTNIIALVYHSPYMHQLARKRYEKQEKQGKSAHSSKISISITDISKLFEASSSEKQHQLLQQHQPTALGEHHSVHDLISIRSMCAALMLHALTEKFVLTDSRSTHVYVWSSDHWLSYMKQQRLLEQRLIVDVSAPAAVAMSRREDIDTVRPVHRRPDAVMSFLMGSTDTAHDNGVLGTLFSHKELVNNSIVIRSALTAYTQAPLWLHTAIFYDLLLPQSYCHQASH